MTAGSDKQLPASSALQALDQLLSASDPDSMGWCDGGDCEIATELLEKFQAAEWSAILRLVGERSPLWRQCLASALQPQHGGTAAQLLFDLSDDIDEGVAFEALSKVAFHCGVNSSAEGEFIDPSIRMPAFLALAKASSPLRRAIQRFSSNGSTSFIFVARFRLLAHEVGF